MIFKKIAVIIFVAIMLVVGLSILFTSDVTKQNSTYVKGHFESLKKETYKGDVSYDLYITENDDYYKISAEWVHCFSADNFINEVKPGQPVAFYMVKGIIPWGTQQVAWLSSGGIVYIDMDCANNDIRQTRYLAPVFSLVISGFAIGLFLASEKKKIKRKAKASRNRQ